MEEIKKYKKPESNVYLSPDFDEWLERTKRVASLPQRVFRQLEKIMEKTSFGPLDYRDYIFILEVTRSSRISCFEYLYIVEEVAQ